MTPPVRRFEPGPVKYMIQKALASAGLEEVKVLFNRSQPKPYQIGKRKYNFAELITMINKLRLASGLQPLTLSPPTSKQRKLQDGLVK